MGQNIFGKMGGNIFGKMGQKIYGKVGRNISGKMFWEHSYLWYGIQVSDAHTRSALGDAVKGKQWRIMSPRY